MQLNKKSNNHYRSGMKNYFTWKNSESVGISKSVEKLFNKVSNRINLDPDAS